MKQLRDIRDDRHVKVEKRGVRYRGHILNLVTDKFVLVSAGSKMMRKYITHDDAVIVLPVREGSGGPGILLIWQYRHSTRSVLWGVSAGLIDKSGEEFMQTAQRELAGEAETAAAEYKFLARFYTSPGRSDELLTVYLVQRPMSAGISFVRQDEGVETKMEWRALNDVVIAVREGILAGPTLVVRTLAAQSLLKG